MAVDLVIDKKLLLPHLKAKDNLDALGQIADNLQRQGYVKAGYKQAILDREAEYPTGLPSPRPTVNQVILPTKIVIMMAIGEPHGQVEMLQKIVEVIQDDHLRHEIANAKDAETLYRLLSKTFEA